MDETEVEKEVLVYPNPSAGLINVHSEELIDWISLVDIQGKTVSRVNCEGKDVQLNYSALNDGYYLLVVAHRNGYIQRERIILN